MNSEQPLGIGNGRGGASDNVASVMPCIVTCGAHR